MGIGTRMRREHGSQLSEAEVRGKLAEQQNDYIIRNEKLMESWEKREGMGLGNGKLAEMYDKDPFRALSLVSILENTERGLVGKLKEYQTSSYLGITPQEIVKVFRFAYGNTVTQDLFNVWGMESVKDTFYKIETQYGSTKRGATEGDVIYESSNGGKYPTSYNEDTLEGDGTTTAFTGTLTNYPALAYSFKVYGEDGPQGNDDGNGAITIADTDGTTLATGTINYTTGAYAVTFTTAPASGVDYELEYAYDAENEDLFAQVGTVKLNLVPYDFRGKFSSVQASWSRFAEEVSTSKLGRSARQDLLDGLSDLVKKASDEFYCSKATKVANWTDALTFDTNFQNAGADSDWAHSQQLKTVIENARGVTYNALERFPARTNLLVGYKAKAYMRKLKGYNVNTNKEEIGFFKDGDVDGYGVYVGTSSIVGASDIYVIGRGKDAMSTDAVLSIGIYKGDINSDELEFATFKNEVGLGQISDYRINNKKMITKVELENLA